MMLIEIMKIISNNFELLDTNEKKFLICDILYKCIFPIKI